MTPLIWGMIGMAGVLVLAIVVGLVKGKGAFAVLIDGRGRYSLSRLQILLWTALVLGGYVGLAAPRVSLAIAIPTEVLGLLGIALGSTVVSTAIKSNQMATGQTATADERTYRIAASAQNEMLSLLGVDRPEALTVDEKAALLEHLSDEECQELNKQIAARRQPSWMDLFSQEQRGSEHLIDIGKMQMFAWTVTALVIYGAMLVQTLTQPQAQLAEVSELPNVTSTILGLMGISQATYLGMKLPDQTGEDTAAG